ncbi:hypothetical protein [Lysobacter sp. Root604]|uniref:hypothetical protein n=1 Tax=Lysobacter sp. Root604 TaxID=1736568 RepID=UPI0006F2E429|nr:hypothetical protein [Lysobacter sp. Root604]KRA16161.1 hypothetical protein ASD69_15625 [Lysobacter sp. Root604]
MASHQGRWWWSLCLFAAAAPAAERPQWLPFMGGETSQAHAIHLSTQKLRPDGLLESASRYPRTSAAGWTAEQHQRGWYEYLERLIDCESGLYVDTALSLLDRDNHLVARRETRRDDQLQQIALTRSDVAAHRWPSHSEIWLACAASRDPAVGADARSTMSDNGGHYAYDFEAIGASLPSDGNGLYERLRAQYDAERARDSMPSPRPASPVAGPYQGAPWLTVGDHEAGAWHVAGLRHRGGGTIEVAQRAGHDRQPPPALPDDADLRIEYKIDCRTGLTVPVAKAYYAADSERLLLRTSTPVFDTVQTLSHDAQGASAWTPWLGPSIPGDAAALCVAAAARCNGGKAQAPGTLFEIDPEDLPAASGAPLLLAARARWLAHRDGFVPACLIGVP